MKLSRRPPAQNVRRVVYSGHNIRSTYTNKAGRTVQCESYLEKVLCMCLDRDIAVVDYISQPVQITWITDGKSHSYVPDFKVWRTNGSSELHEVTLTTRQNENNIIERTKAAQIECQKRGWAYIIHTEKTLPQATAIANLELLFCYRAQAYFSQTLTSTLLEDLADQTHKNLAIEVERLHQTLSLPQPQIIANILHLIWHGIISTDFEKLIFQAGNPARATNIWLSKVA